MVQEPTQPTGQSGKSTSSGQMSGRQGSLVRRGLPLLAIVALLGLAWALGWFEYLSFSSLIRHREMLADLVAGNMVLAILGYIVVYAILVAISFPGASLLTIMSGFLFGGLVGGLVAVLAATLGAVGIFLIARTSLGQVLEERAGPFARKMVSGFNEDAFFYLLSLRLAPVFPFWVVNIVPAMFNMKLSSYTAATVLGIIPATFAYAFIGAGLDSVIAAQEQANPGCAGNGDCTIDPSSLVTPQLALALAGLAVISILPVAVRKFRSNG